VAANLGAEMTDTASSAKPPALATYAVTIERFSSRDASSTADAGSPPVTDVRILPTMSRNRLLSECQVIARPQ
jgi:hypothetical protein